jgi:ankyrin repeat protein
MGAASAFQLAARWNLGELTILLEREPLLAQASDKLGYTLLHRVALAKTRKLGRPAEDAVAVANLLLAAGADLEAVRLIPDDGELFPATPLWCATAWGRNLPLVENFLRRGAKADWCLWAAVSSSDLPLLAMLLGVKPVLEHKIDGETPFFYAVRLRRFEAARMLAEVGADRDTRNRDGETPSELARRRGYPKALLNWLSGTGPFPHTPAGAI